MRIKIATFLYIGLGVILILPNLAYASTTIGTIDSTYKYAWGNNIGWINFGTTNGNVQITDSSITGYAWSDNYGWINLNPTNGGVLNDDGNLSGNAWSEQMGWIDFDGVGLSAGQFTGTATGTVAGTITFGCTNCDVRTDYRTPTERGGSGGSTGSPASVHPELFATNPSTIINDTENTIIITGSKLYVVNNLKFINVAENEYGTNNEILIINFELIDDFTIEATLPVGLQKGTYDVQVFSGGQTWATLSNGLTVTDPDFPDEIEPSDDPELEDEIQDDVEVIEPTVPEFFNIPFRYEWMSQNGDVVGDAHVLYTKPGEIIPMELVIKNRAIDQDALVIYGKDDLLPELAPYRGAHELRIGTSNPHDKLYDWLDGSSYISNPDGLSNRLAVYNGEKVNIGGLIKLNWDLKLKNNLNSGTYDLYVAVLREFDKWAEQIDKFDIVLDREDIFWRIIID